MQEIILTFLPRHCEAEGRSNLEINLIYPEILDCFAALAMTKY